MKTRFKDATIIAIAEWTAGRGPYILNELLYLAAYIRASGVIDVLRKHLIDSGELEGLRNIEVNGKMVDAYDQAIATVVGVIRGFAPLEKAKTVLKRLFDSDYYGPRFAPQLFLGLCECVPEQYTDYVPRFLELRELQTYPYSMPHIIFELIRIVSLETVVETLHKLDRETQPRFLMMLLLSKNSPLKYKIKYTWQNDELVRLL